MNRPGDIEEVAPRGRNDSRVLITELIHIRIEDLLDKVPAPEDVFAARREVVFEIGIRLLAQRQEAHPFCIQDFHGFNAAIDRDGKRDLTQGLSVFSRHSLRHALSMCDRAEQLQLFVFFLDHPLGGQPAGLDELVGEAFLNGVQHHVGYHVSGCQGQNQC